MLVLVLYSLGGFFHWNADLSSCVVSLIPGRLVVHSCNVFYRVRVIVRHIFRYDYWPTYLGPNDDWLTERFDLAHSYPPVDIYEDDL